MVSRIGPPIPMQTKMRWGFSVFTVLMRSDLDSRSKSVPGETRELEKLEVRSTIIG